MNCQDFEKIVLDLARNQSRDKVGEQALEHAESCSRCSGRLAEERALFGGMRAVVAELSDKEAPDSVEAALLAAFRTQNSVSAQPVVMQASVKPGHRFVWRAGAIAAGILLLLSVLTVLWQRSDLRRNQSTEVPQPSNTVTPQPPAPQSDDNHQVVVQQHSPPPRRHVRHASRNNSDEAEVATQFFPLAGYADDLSALESVRLIRVELSGSALSDVGLPVVPESRNTPVKADVVLGPDGSARAIRFIR